MCINGAGAAVRDGGAAVRAKNGTTSNSQQRLTNSKKTARSVAVRTPTAGRVADTTSKTTVSRAATSRAGAGTSRPGIGGNTGINQTQTPRVVARAATSATDLSQTRTGAEYERCKTAYFTCMDQFCGQKNDDYRRCSCSNRVYDLTDAREALTQAGEKLTVFTENLDVVGMTAAQAAAMKTASEGENALTEDMSASKALLQAILDSIRGKDSDVGGKMSDLNSINISFDTANAFGVADSGQVIAAYNGQNLYSAVYPQCRAAVQTDCNDASLQRAVTAYLMAVEQDCNTVQTAIDSRRKEMKSAIREGSAMLDLARVENRQKHNSSDIPTCIADVESAILSEQVCGANYHKCLDNGEFIDITTGAPIAGVTDFYKLAEMLTFADGVDAANQKLSKNTANRTFVQNFESKTKKFAADALDKCVEDADIVWAEYLDKALLDIYYAQRAKVDVIKQGCFDFVASCYMNAEDSITAAMKELTGDSGLTIVPSQVVLTGAMCTDYVNSCNSLFNSDIIKDYITYRQDADTLTACRAVVKQCFDSFGGTNYENFYYPYSGLFNKGSAPDWFTLYEYTNEAADAVPGEEFTLNDRRYYAHYKSTCAKQLTDIDACNSTEMIEEAFGGFDKIKASIDISEKLSDNDSTGDIYGFITKIDDDVYLSHRKLRSIGVATEVYNQVIDILTTQCTNLDGRFVELQHGAITSYSQKDVCLFDGKLADYGVYNSEDMCPRDYSLSVDTASWGMCSCWENGGRRSKNGKAANCIPVIPVDKNANDKRCENMCVLNSTTDSESEQKCKEEDMCVSNGATASESAWCTQEVSTENQVNIPNECAANN